MIGRLGNDIPLRRDGTVRVLPWLIAPMVYLAALALAGMLTLHGVLQSWDRGLSGTMTVELPPAPPAPAADTALPKALEVLRATPGIVSVAPLSTRRREQAASALARHRDRARRAATAAPHRPAHRQRLGDRSQGSARAARRRGAGRGARRSSAVARPALRPRALGRGDRARDLSHGRRGRGA